MTDLDNRLSTMIRRNVRTLKAMLMDFTANSLGFRLRMEPINGLDFSAECLWLVTGCSPAPIVHVALHDFVHGRKLERRLTMDDLDLYQQGIA